MWMNILHSYSAATVIGTARVGCGEVPRSVSPKEGNIVFSRGDKRVFGRTVQESNKVEATFRGSKGDRGRKVAIYE